LEPHDAAALERFRTTVRPALHAMICDKLPPPNEVELRHLETIAEEGGRHDDRYWLSRERKNEMMPALGIRDSDFDGTVIVWIHPAGRGSLDLDGESILQTILGRKAAVLAVDVIGTGDLSKYKPAVNDQYAGYTFGYNRPLLAERVHDILTAIAFAKSLPNTKRIHLVGWESSGPWVVLAKALAGDAVSRCAADLDGFRFDSVRTNDDPMMLPGALKYGGMAAFAALCAPGDLLLHNHRGTGTGELVPMAYRAASAEKRLKRSPEKLTPSAVIEWLLPAP
jgi:hypothetical protein